MQFLNFIFKQTPKLISTHVSFYRLVAISSKPMASLPIKSWQSLQHLVGNKNLKQILHLYEPYFVSISKSLIKSCLKFRITQNKK